jgi:hypothetical protein
LQPVRLGIPAAHPVDMPITTTLPTIETSELESVSGGRTWGEAASDAWQGTKNFAGGATAGLLHGAEVKNSQVERFAEGNSRATKAGFEMGAMGNMAMGNFGQALSAGADRILPATEK